MPVEYENDHPAAPRDGLGPYRAGDYFGLPEEPRCELVYGRLLVTPAPSAQRHQRVLARLFTTLVEAARGAGAELFFAPVDVLLAEHSVVQPDLVWISADHSATVGDHIEGAPDLVVEVLSPSTARRDRGEKLRLYAEAGVAEYWVVDPQARTFEFLENRDGAFIVRLPDAGRYRSSAVAGAELDLEVFWSALPE